MCQLQQLPAAQSHVLFVTDVQVYKGCCIFLCQTPSSVVCPAITSFFISSFFLPYPASVLSFDALLLCILPVQFVSECSEQTWVTTFVVLPATRSGSLWSVSLVKFLGGSLLVCNKYHGDACTFGESPGGCVSLGPVKSQNGCRECFLSQLLFFQCGL